MNRSILKFILIGTTSIFSPTQPAQEEAEAAACATPAINHEKLGTLARLPDVAYHRIGLIPLLSDAILPYIFAQTLPEEKEKLTRELENLKHKLEYKTKELEILQKPLESATSNAADPLRYQYSIQKSLAYLQHRLETAPIELENLQKQLVQPQEELAKLQSSESAILPKYLEALLFQQAQETKNLEGLKASEAAILPRYLIVLVSEQETIIKELERLHSTLVKQEEKLKRLYYEASPEYRTDLYAKQSKASKQLADLKKELEALLFEQVATAARDLEALQTSSHKTHPDTVPGDDEAPESTSSAQSKLQSTQSTDLQEIERIQKEIEKIKNTIQYTEYAIEDLQHFDPNWHENDIRDTTQEISQTQQEISRKQEEIARIQQNITRIPQTIERPTSYKIYTPQKVASSFGFVHSYPKTQKYTGMQSMQQKAPTELESITQELESIQKAIPITQRKIAYIQHDLKVLPQEHKTSNSINTEQEAESVTQEVVRIKQAITTIKRTIEGIQYAITRKSEEIKHLPKEIEKTKQTIERIPQEIASLMEEIAEKQHAIENKQQEIEANTLAKQALNPDDLPFLDLGSLATLALTNQALRAQMQTNLATAKKYLMTWKVAQITQPDNLVDKYLVNIKGVKSPTDQAIVFGQMLQMLFPLPDKDPYDYSDYEGPDFHYAESCDYILERLIERVSFYSQIPAIATELEKIYPNLSLFLWHLMCLSKHSEHTCASEALYRAILHSPFANPQSLYLMLKAVLKGVNRAKDKLPRQSLQQASNYYEQDPDYRDPYTEIRIAEHNARQAQEIADFDKTFYTTYLVSDTTIQAANAPERYYDDEDEDDTTSSAAAAASSAPAKASTGIPLHEIFSVQRIKDLVQHPHVKPEHLFFLLKLPAELFRDTATTSVIINRIINHPNVTVNDLFSLLNMQSDILIDTAIKLRIVDKIIHHSNLSLDNLCGLLRLTPETLIDQATKLSIINKIINHSYVTKEKLLSLLNIEPETLINRANKIIIIEKMIALANNNYGQLLNKKYVDAKYRLQLMASRHIPEEYQAFIVNAHTYNEDGSLQPAELERFQAAEELYKLHKGKAISAYTLLSEDTTISSANKAKALAELERIKAEVAASGEATAVVEPSTQTSQTRPSKAEKRAATDALLRSILGSKPVPPIFDPTSTSSTYAACAAAAEGMDD